MKQFIPLGNRLIWAFAAWAQLNCVYAQTQFTRVASGNWTSPAGWSPLGIPGPADSATIGTFDVTLDTNVTVSNLTLNLGAKILSGDGTRGLTVLHSGSWSGGTILGIKLRLDTSCNFVFSDGNKAASAGTFTNAGTIHWTGGQLALENNHGFYNESGAVFDAQFDGTMIQNTPQYQRCPG